MHLRALAATLVATLTIGGFASAPAAAAAPAAVGATTPKCSTALTPDWPVREPELVGRATSGSTLRLGLPDPSNLTAGSIQWMRDGVDIPGETSREITVTGKDTGSVLSVRFTTTPPGGGLVVTQTLASSTITPGKVSVMGMGFITDRANPAVGKTLTLKEQGAWCPPDADVSVTYQWLRDGVPIPGATSRSYTPRTADQTAMVILHVTGSAPGYRDRTVSAAGARIPRVMTMTSRPKISGSRTIGKTLTVSAGGWSPRPSSHAFQWYRSGKAIPGATGNQYTLTRSDAGRYINARVSVGAKWHSQTSSAAIRVGIPTHATTKPKVRGTAERGSTLSARRGYWTPTPSSYTYRWYRGTTAIRYASASTYKLTSADIGHRIRVKVITKRTGHVSGTTYSASTPSVRR